MRSLASQYEDWVRALGIRAAAPIPCTARSLPHEEARTQTLLGAAWPILVAGIGALVGGFLYVPALPPDVQVWVWGALAALVIFAAYLAWSRLDEFRDYVDPQLSVEASAEAVVICGPTGCHHISYAELPRPSLLSEGGRSASFRGISFDSPLGHVLLHDDYYSDGRVVAGAILKQVEELGLWETLRQPSRRSVRRPRRGSRHRR